MSFKQNRRSFLSKSAMAGAGLMGLSSQTWGQGFIDAKERTSQLSAPSDITIKDVTVAYSGGSMYIKMTSNQDIVGWGEAVDAIPGTYYLARQFGQRLRGRSPLAVNRLVEDIRKGGFFQGAQSGMFIAVLTGIEHALWDLTGKALGLPVYQLLGGKFRDKVRVYCDTALYQTNNPKPEDFAIAAKKSKDMGFNAVKFDLDQAGDPGKYDRYNWTASPMELRRMYDQMAAARAAVGSDIDICVDMHGRYDAPTGEKVAKMLEPINLMWLEEPIPAENVEAYKKITDSTSTPICAGENHYLAYGFRRMMEIGAVDMIMPDLQKCGGLAEGQRIANLANLYYVPFAPHMVASFLGAMACAHVCASVPNFMIMEWQSYFHTQPKYKDIVVYEGEWVDKSFITVSNKPGIGVDINEEGLKKYATPNVPFFA